eukprot:scaffold28046_cov19-Tisochrysis_lutea.AAC.2
MPCTLGARPQCALQAWFDRGSERGKSHATARQHLSLHLLRSRCSTSSVRVTKGSQGVGLQPETLAEWLLVKAAM